MLIERPERARTPRKMPTAENAPKLAMTYVPKFRVKYKDLEKFIHDVFGFEFDFLFAAGLLNGSGAEYVVTGELPTAAWVQNAQNLRQGRRTRSIPLILAVLAHDKYIPVGYYTILT